MKKGLSKLILSGAAVAAVAATLGTSTYAWYTTNPTVSANNIVGASNDTTASSISISKTYAGTKRFSASVTFDGNDTTGFSTLNASKLVPLTYVSAGTFKSLDVSTGDLSATAASKDASTDVALFTLFFKTSATTETVNLYIKSFDIYNTTGITGSDSLDTYAATLPSADNLLFNENTAAGSGTDVGGMLDTDPLYAVDFRKSLGIAVYNTASGGFDSAFTLNNGTFFKGGTPTVASGVTEVTTGAAQTYYDNVMETDLKSPAKTVLPAYAAQPIATLDNTGVNYATIKFYIFLDGASQFNYNACVGQKFVINMEFTSDVTKALGYVSGN